MKDQEQLTEVFREVFGDESIELRSEMTANDIEGWDSMSHVNLIIAIEIKFGIEFTPMEIRSFSSVGELATCIAEKTGF